MKKPLLLLDIDGVLNVLSEGKGLRKTRIRGYTIHLNPAHKAWVEEFEKYYEVVWSTMWQDHARTHFAPKAGFGSSWSYIDFDKHWNDEELAARVFDETQHLRGAVTWNTRTSVGEYKHPGFLQTIGNRPAVVVDDDLELWQHDWAVERSTQVSTCMIQPDPFEGLHAEDAELILDFAHSL